MALVLSLVMASCFSLNVMAIDANTPEEVSLKTVFEEAALKAAPKTRAGEAEPKYYEEYVTPEGDVIEYISYDTDYAGNDDEELLPNQEADGRIYMMRASLYTSEDGTSGEVWGYLFSRIKYEMRSAVMQGITHTQKRIDSFSYELEPASGYNFSSMNINYYSYDGSQPNNSVNKTITVTQTKMTNYPTTSLGWVTDNVEKPIGETAVTYTPTLNGKSYRCLSHRIV